MGLLTYILVLILLIGVLAIAYFVFNDIVYGQNATPPAVTPTLVPTPTPTSPAPNLQYLPQKSYIQTFVPEQGVPLAQPATSYPQFTTPQQSTTVPTDLMSIISVLTGAGAIAYSKIIGNKTNKVEGITKENLSAVLQDKEAIAELAKFAYASNPEAANKLDNAPCIKLDNLEKQKADFADKASKA